MSMFRKVGMSLGGFFNVKDHTDAIAVLFEPKRSRTVPSKYKNAETGEFTKLAIDCDITIFDTKEQLLGKKEPTILEGATCTDTSPAKALAQAIDEKVLSKCTTVPNKNGGNPIPVIDDITDSAIIQAVEEYVNKRDAELEKALAEDLPDFMKG